MKLEEKRIRSSVVVVNKAKILGFHAEDPVNKAKYFFLPGGKIEEGESVVESAERETLEETGYRVKIDEKSKIFREYKFEWTGKIYHCETWYFKAELISQENTEIEDAEYHRGVDWIDIGEIDKLFSYHKDILEPIKELLGV